MPTHPNLYTDHQCLPAVALNQMLAGHQVTQMIGVAAELDIADLLSDGPQTVEDLALQAQVDAPSLRRVMRGLASVGVFARLPDGRYDLTPVGSYLQRGVEGSLRNVAAFANDPFMRGPWDALLHTVKSGSAAWDHVFGTSGFQYLTDHPETARRFDERSTSNTGRVADAIAAAYDFAPFHTVVDVGGSYGQLVGAVLRANRHLDGLVFDMAHAHEGAERHLAAMGIAGRCRVVSGDFFEAVPDGGDVYLLKSVLHDWDDTRCCAILRNCHRAVRGTTKLLIVERLMPEDDEPSFEIARYDVMMMVMGGRERTESEYRHLFDASGFCLRRVVPTGTEFSILEAELL